MIMAECRRDSKTEKEEGSNLQNVANDSHTPHVRAEVDGIEIDHFGSDKLGGAEQDLHLLLWVELASQAKVNYLDAITLS